MVVGRRECRRAIYILYIYEGERGLGKLQGASGT